MSIPSGQPALTATGLTVRYGAQPVLEDTGMTICAGDRIGVVGRNGAGKSTLLHILAGALVPDQGELTTAKGLRRGFLPQEFALVDAPS
jgi:ATPase subunit of ABC transporter with duplicated ATPase domains